MNKSENINELAAALSKAQSEILGAKKTTANKFFNSQYADLAEVWEACRDPITKNGLCVMQPIKISDDGSVVVETLLAHSSGQWVSDELKMLPKKNDPQGVGSCITYGRRYGLAAMVGIPQVDDDGETAMGRGNNQKINAQNDYIQPKILTTEEYEKLCELHVATIDYVKFSIDTGDLSSAKESWDELDNDTKALLWKAPSKGGCFTTEQRRIMQTPEFRDANQ